MTARHARLCHQPRRQSNWWQSFYDDAAMLVLNDQSEQTVRRQVDQMVDVGRFEPGDSVIDQCCGLGQHAIEMATRGFRVTAIDQSDEYIDAARRQSRQRDVPVTFVVADALQYVQTPPVDRIVNWHSSFGYLKSDRGNLKMLQCAFSSLRPGGTMMLDFPNMAHLLQHFQEEMRSPLPGGGKLTRRSRIDLSRGLLRQEWTYELPDGGRRRHQSRLRLYLPDRIRQMMCRAGFAFANVYSHSGEALTLDDARCLVLASRGDE